MIKVFNIKTNKIFLLLLMCISLILSNLSFALWPIFLVEFKEELLQEEQLFLTKQPLCFEIGFGMGDVVLSLVLKDKGLLEDGDAYLLTPELFVVSASDEGDSVLPTLVSSLRASGLHARQSYKSTRNVGKLLTEAAKTNAKHVVILGKELEQGNAVVKNLESGEQVELALESIVEYFS